MTEALVRDYYTESVRREWRRLVRDAYHGLEFQTTLHSLENHLPPNGLILDAGGGPGRYTIELARRGYEVVLLDMTPANLEFASWPAPSVYGWGGRRMRLRAETARASAPSKLAAPRTCGKMCVAIEHTFD